MRIVKLLFRAVFNAHVFALAFVAFIVHNLYETIGAIRARPVTGDDVVFVAVLFVVVLMLGWLAGVEAGQLARRRIREQRDEALRHMGDMRRLNANLIDDVLMAARNGLPVKSFPYGGAGKAGEIDRAVREHERAREQAAFDLSGRL